MDDYGILIGGTIVAGIVGFVISIVLDTVLEKTRESIFKRKFPKI